MATLTDGSLALSLIHLEHDEDIVFMGMGLFCDGIPVLAPLINYTDERCPPGYVEVEDDSVVESGIVRSLRSVLTEKWPAFWRNYAEEMGGEIIAYPGSFYYAVHPSLSIPWNEALPELGIAAAKHFRHSITTA